MLPPSEAGLTQVRNVVPNCSNGMNGISMIAARSLVHHRSQLTGTNTAHAISTTRAPTNGRSGLVSGRSISGARLQNAGGRSSGLARSNVIQVRFHRFLPLLEVLQ